MWEFPSVEMVSAFDEGEQGLEELAKDLGFALSLQPVLVKELTHIFSHRKWFMKAFRGDLTYAGDAKNRRYPKAIAKGLDAHQARRVRRLCLGRSSW